jgi:alginate O-acetyltransferase complex protein AlgI
LGERLVATTKYELPATIPLGISFFTFEFVHYLSDVQRGTPPIRRPMDFAAFIFYWPTMVAGPIKRYEQFVPALHKGLLTPPLEDAATGLSRVAIGMVKKWTADNLSGWIDFVEPQYAQSSIGHRWLFLGALALRIYLDFGGYSDMAIGFARMMGIAVPENFNWPYIARSPMEFWRRWHISLSTWIRDYVYIPLGGNRLGLHRRVANAIAAMALCGLWHGAAWNFVIWGIYHGIGLTVGTLIEARFGRLVGVRAVAPPGLGASAEFIERPNREHLVASLSFSLRVLSWAATLLFVCVGWLLFFYPIAEAVEMTILLFRR